MKSRNYIIRTIVFLAIVFAVQYFFIASVPDIVFFIAKYRSGKPLNTVIQAPKTDAKLRKVVLPNPDFVYNAVFYDLSKSDLIISGEFPDTSQYCSLAFYGDDVQPYQVMNNLTSQPRTFRFHLTQRNGNTVVVSPSNQGAILMRLLVTSEEQYKNARRLQKILKVETLEK